MEVEVKVPNVGESITEVQIGDWLVREGQEVGADAPLVVLESDKASVELPAPAAGRVARVLRHSGETAKIGETIAVLEDGAAGVVSSTTPERPPAAGPAARRALTASGLAPERVAGSGPHGRILLSDVDRELHREGGNGGGAVETVEEAPAPAAQETRRAPPAPEPRGEERVPMSGLRFRVAQNLVRAQQTAALLTTFNEIDMSAVAAMREANRESFQGRHGVKLGILSFFVKATVDALRRIPQLNAEIQGEEIVYRRYQDIGIAIGSGKGLVVPVLRDAQSMSFADIERGIDDFAKRARENKLLPADLSGGTFTISNGGVYGSMLSTPIVNPPQSGILGLHAIEERPVVRGGAVVVRPMMYVALTYDHRIVDGREAITFLRRVKEVVEHPERLLLDV